MMHDLSHGGQTCFCPTFSYNYIFFPHKACTSQQRKHQGGGSLFFKKFAKNQSSSLNGMDYSLPLYQW